MTFDVCTVFEEHGIIGQNKSTRNMYKNRQRSHKKI